MQYVTPVTIISDPIVAPSHTDNHPHTVAFPCVCISSDFILPCTRTFTSPAEKDSMYVSEKYVVPPNSYPRRYPLYDVWNPGYVPVAEYARIFDHDISTLCPDGAVRIVPPLITIEAPSYVM